MPSVAQLAMIDRAAWLSLHLSMMDAKILEGGDAVLTDRDGRQYLAWANTLNRLLRDIGLNGKPQVASKTLKDIIAEHAA
ncbi:hypothetical protein OCK01_00410 [Rhizobium sp. TRM95796]|nr:hypothetical protein [Rhizobium sp. TRM95796]